MIKVSVIIPVYNAEQYLRQCLDSVLGQSLKEIEVICVDDGSTDSSLGILREYERKDRRLKILTQANSGPARARNNALTQAMGEYLVFLDADDWFEADFLEKMSVCIEKNKADICICKAQRFDSASGKALPSDWMLKTELVPDEAFSPEEAAQYIFQFTYGQVWDKLYRRSFLLESGILFPELRNSEDTAFAYTTLLSAGRIAVLPEVFVHYRVNVSSSVSSSIVNQPEAPYEAFRIIYEHLEFMENKGLFRQSFLNWAMEYLVWHVTNMPDKEIRKQNLSLVREVWFPTLQFEMYPRQDYYNKTAYLKYIVVRHLPYKILDRLLFAYKAGKK